MYRHEYSEKVRKIASWKSFSLPLTSGNFLCFAHRQTWFWQSLVCLMEEGPEKVLRRSLISHSLISSKNLLVLSHREINNSTPTCLPNLANKDSGFTSSYKLLSASPSLQEAPSHKIMKQTSWPFLKPISHLRWRTIVSCGCYLGWAMLSQWL